MYKRQTWLDHDWNIKTITNEHTAIFDWLVIIQKNAFIFIVLILLVVSSNLTSIVLIQVTERTSMIGILKALGASNGCIQRIMLWSNLYMVGWGMFWGNLAGIGLCALQSFCKLIALDPMYYYTAYVPIAWDWQIIVGLNLLTIVVVTTTLSIAIAIVNKLKLTRAIRFR